MRFLSRLFRNQSRSQHVVKIALIDDESIVTFDTNDSHSLNDIKNYIVNNLHVISFVQHKIVFPKGDNQMYTRGICNIDFETGKMKPCREKVLDQSDINFVLERLI